MKKFELSVLVALILSIIVSSFSVFAKNCEGIKNEVFRLHILANSDSDADQKLKLKVRDRILSESANLFSGSGNLCDAEASARENLERIVSIAEDEIKKEGYDYEVTAEVCDTFFETRQYNDITLPAGVYSALQIKIGKAEGKNWWCVLFPALCIPAAQDDKELCDILSLEQVRTVKKPVYKAKFFIFEWFEKLKNM